MHAMLSLDTVSGEHWYYINNRVLNVEAPGHPDEENRGGKIFKFHDARFPSASLSPCTTRFRPVPPTPKKSETRHWTHKNTALGICVGDPDCNPDRKLFGSEFVWHESHDLATDVCDHDNFPARLIQQGYLVDGHNTGPNTFAAPRFEPGNRANHGEWNGELSLAPNSPGAGASSSVRLRRLDGGHLALPGGQDVGASDALEIELR